MTADLVTVEPTVEQQLDAIAARIEAIQTGAIFQIGRELIRARDLNGRGNYHGGFEGWVADKLRFSYATAKRMIQVTEDIKDQSLTYERVSINALLEISRADEDVQSAIAARVEAGEIFTADQVRTIREEAAEAATAVAQERIEQIEATLADERETSAADRIKLANELADLKEKIRKAAKAVSPEEAEKLSAESGGGAVLANDGEYHRAHKPSLEQRRASASYFAFQNIIGHWADNPDPPAMIVTGASDMDRDVILADIDRSIAYLLSVKEALLQ